MGKTSVQTASQDAPKARRIAQGRRIVQMAGRAQPIVVPRTATADQAFIAASLNYRRCNREYMKASAAWAEFAGRYGYDDPAHADHHVKRMQTRRALDSADEALSIAEEKLLGIRS